MIIKVGTRGSKLALAQTNYVIDRLKQAFPENEYEAVIIKTTGDKDQTRPLDQIGSKGLFVDEIERALLADEIQLAVHSMKDMPSDQPEGLVFAKAWDREDPRDVLILKNGNKLSDLPQGANVATGSKRRSYQLLALRPDINIFPIRGNIDTRIKKLHEGLADGTELDGIILAAAGLKRLHIESDNYYFFDFDEMIPSPAQGTLALELNKSNTKLLEMVNSLSSDESEDFAFLERGFLQKIDGDCHLPIGAIASKTNAGYNLKALFGDEEGKHLARVSVNGAKADESLIDMAIREINKQLENS